MSRAASPVVKVGLLIAVVLLGCARVRGKDLPTSSQEITKCLAACRAVCARRIADAERAEKCPARDGRAASEFGFVGPGARTSAC